MIPRCTFLLLLLSTGALLSTGGSVGAVDCACVHVAANSFADTGVCTVLESNTSFCTLDWRHGVDSEPFDHREMARAERQTRAFIESTEGKVFFSTVLSETVLNDLAALAGDVKSGQLYRGAATYLEQRPPHEYLRDMAIASMVVIIASSASPENSRLRTFLLDYASKYPDQLFARMTGTVTTGPEAIETSIGMVSDLSAYGCVEIRLLESGNSDYDFVIRIGVRTSYAEDERCLRRN